jgi:hypothetical protein
MVNGIDPALPVLAMALNEAGGPTAINGGSLGAGGDGTYQGGVTYAQPGPGAEKAALFDGASGYVDLLTPALTAAFAAGITGVSYVLWASADVAAGANFSGLLILGDTSGAWYLRSYFANYGSGDFIQTDIGDGVVSGSTFYALALPTTGLKYGYTFDYGLQRCKAFAGGEIVGIGPIFGVLGNTAPPIPFAALARSNNAPPVNMLNGAEAQFALWTKALSDAQMEQLTS